MKMFFVGSLPTSGYTRHPCIPPTTPVLYHELCQWIIIGLIHWKSQKKAVKSNLGKFLRKCNFNFFNAKNWPIFASFEPSFPSSSIFLTFGIELMFPEDSQILVHDFRHQNFGIWTFLGWVMAILVKKFAKSLICIANWQIMSVFHENGHNSAQKSPNSKILVFKVIN